MREELCYENFKQVQNRLDKYDPELSELFQNIYRRVIKEFCFNEGEGQRVILPIIYTDEENIDEKIIESDTANHHGRKIHIGSLNHGEINIIPGDNSSPCYENCVVTVQGPWGGRAKSSFLKLSKELVKYWLGCLKNKRTLILTTTWDEKSFDEEYRDEYNIYSRNHSLVVILVTSTGPSIQYMGK